MQPRAVNACENINYFKSIMRAFRCFYLVASIYLFWHPSRSRRESIGQVMLFKSCNTKTERAKMERLNVFYSKVIVILINEKVESNLNKNPI